MLDGDPQVLNATLRVAACAGSVQAGMAFLPELLAACRLRMQQASCACCLIDAHSAGGNTRQDTQTVGARQAYFSAFLLCSCCCSVPSLPAPG